MSFVVQTTRVVILVGSLRESSVWRLTNPGALLCASPLRSKSLRASSTLSDLAQWCVSTPIIVPPSVLLTPQLPELCASVTAPARAVNRCAGGVESCSACRVLRPSAPRRHLLSLVGTVL